MGWGKEEFEVFNKILSNVNNENNLTLTEIQYLRGLVYIDQLNNKYRDKGMAAKICQDTSMYEFTNKILNKLDKLEDGLN